MNREAGQSRGGPEANENAALALHTMAGRNHIDLAARCLSSIVKYYDRPIHVIVHEDGSVGPEDVARFQEACRAVPSSSRGMPILS